MNGSTPMSTSRLMADTALLVCSVVSTRWPVRDALHGQLGGLGVADLADQHDVGVLAQHRTQAAAEGQAAALVHLHLGDAGDLHLDRVLERDDVAVRRVDLLQRRVERAGLAAARRAGEQHQALRGLQHPAEVGELVRVETDVRQRLAAASAGASSRMTTFSPCTEGSELTRASTSCPSTAIRVRPSCGSRRSPMSSPDTIFSRLTTDASALRGTDMTSRSTPSTRYRMRRLSRCGSMWMSLAPIRTASASTMLTSRTVGAASLVEAPSSSSAGPVSSKNVETSEESSASDQARVSWSEIWVSVATITTSSVAPRVQPDVVQRDHVGRVARGQRQPAALLGQDQHPEPSRDAAREQPHGLRRDDHPVQVDHLEPQLVGQRLGDLPLGDHAQVHEHVAEPAAGPDHGPLGVQGCRELRRGDHLGVDEHVTEPAAVPARVDPAGSSSGSRAVMPQGIGSGGRLLQDFSGCCPAGRTWLEAAALLQLLEQLAQLGAQEVPGGDVADRDPEGRELAGQVVGVGDVALGPGPVLLVLHPVAVGLAVLGEQDQRRRVGGLQREHQGEQR